MDSDRFQELRELGQGDLIDYLKSADVPRGIDLAQQLDGIDLSTLRQQRELLLNPPVQEKKQYKPFGDYLKRGNSEDRKRGEHLLAKGAVGCLIVAGGQGTRLKFDGPKGMVVVTEDGKSLFQLFTERILEAGRQYDRTFPVAIMTSPLNHEQTVTFFQENNSFGLQQDQLFFFSQKTLPLLDDKGRLFLDSPNSISTGPNGNGVALHHFCEEGLWEEWRSQGVEMLNFVQIDNPLADPFDPELIGYHAGRNNEVTLKCIEREDPNEKVGVIVSVEGQARVIEYSEMSESEQLSCDEKGKLRHICANISCFCFSMEFIKKYTGKKAEPTRLHLAHKAVKTWSPSEKEVRPEKPNAWKFEAFIFDCLREAKHVSALLYPRSECFAPLKNASGPDSIETVRAALR